jgi:hypothetical protein
MSEQRFSIHLPAGEGELWDSHAFDSQIGRPTNIRYFHMEVPAVMCRATVAADGRSVELEFEQATDAPV